MNHSEERRQLDKAVEYRFLEFTRAWRAAVSMLSLYPPEHPAVDPSLVRLGETAGRAIGSDGAFLTVRPRELLLDQAAPSRTDRATEELARLLHEHRIAGLHIRGDLGVDGWRALLLLQGRSADAVKAEGGFGRVWNQSGHGQIEVYEIDYEQLLEERNGTETAALAVVLTSATGHGRGAEPDAETLMAAADDPEALADLAAAIAGEAAGDDDRQARTWLLLLRSVAEVTAERHPGQLDRQFGNLAREVSRLSPAVVSRLLAQAGMPEATVGALDVITAVTQRMDEDAIAGFVARAVIEGDDPGRALETAFHGLVPESARHPEVLARARALVQESALDEGAVAEERWAAVTQALTGDTNATAEYAQALAAGSPPLTEIERLLDDPPERIAEWLATVDTEAVDELDHQLLLDLLEIESDPEKWCGLLPTVIGRIESAGVAGRLGDAVVLVNLLARIAEEDGAAARGPSARNALRQLAEGPFLGAAVGHLGTDQSRAAQEVCLALGPGVVGRLVKALSRELDSVTQQRLVKILAEFGKQSHEVAQQLMDAPSWRLRSTAAYVLWAAGGDGALVAMERLLGDSEPRARGEAVRAIAVQGDEPGHAMLVQALVHGDPAVKRSLVSSLTTLRDKRAAGFFSYLVKHAMGANLPLAVYARAMEVIVQAPPDDAVDTLRLVLHAGRWWAPVRTWRLRRSAARALRGLGTPDALEALRTPSFTGATRCT